MADTTTTLTTSPNWFDKLFDEFSGRNEAMFAFSRSQVEEHVPWDEFASGWASVGAGLHVKRSALPEFLRRLEHDRIEWEATLPALRVRHIGFDYDDRPLYRAEDGRKLVDVNYAPPNEAQELHIRTPEGEPIAALAVRLIFDTDQEAS